MDVFHNDLNLGLFGVCTPMIMMIILSFMAFLKDFYFESTSASAGLLCFRVWSVSVTR